MGSMTISWGLILIVSHQGAAESGGRGCFRYNDIWEETKLHTQYQAEKTIVLPYFLRWYELCVCEMLWDSSIVSLCANSCG